MKKVFFLLIAQAGFYMATAQIKELAIGSIMPMGETKMTDVSGKEVSLASAASNKGLLVMFSCNTCPYVIKNQQRTKEILGYAQSKGIGIAVVNSNEAYRGKEDSYEAMQAYAKDQQYQWIYSVDKNNAIADAFGATRTPECFLFDAGSILVYHGAIDDSPADAAAVKRIHLKEAINEMLDGKQVSVSNSRSVGCMIKRVSKP